MQWIAPTEKNLANDTLERKLWDAANQLWAGAGLKQSDYSEPILGLIFLRFAEVRFSARRAELEKTGASARRGSKVDDPTAYHAEGVLFLASGARFAELLQLPEGTDIGKALNEAMKVIERDNPQMAGVLPKGYQVFDSRLLSNLLKTLSTIPADLEGDAFGKIYEYFLGTFAMSEGQKGGEFFTPTSIVRFLVEVLEPFHGRILDPACGSGGMFVQSARFVSAHKASPPSPAASRHPLPVGEGGGEGLAVYSGDPARELSIHGQERVDGNVRLARMNLAVHGLEGEIKHGNTYYEDLHSTVGKFDFVCANPPFNVSQVDKERLSAEVGTGRRYPFGLPRTDNANYLWIQDFYSALNDKGRAGFVMANSASDARASEQDIRQKLIESRAVDVMVAVGPNMFYTVALPCTLWFFDKGKAKTPRADTVLFIDARHIYRQIDRAHRDWTDAQISFMANIVRLYRGEEPDYTLGGEEAQVKLTELFGSDAGTPARNAQGSADTPVRSGPKPAGKSARITLAYRDIPGLCKAATLAEIEAQGWSLNPGRYVGVAPGEAVSDEDFKTQLGTWNEELETLNAQARELEQTIGSNVAEILEA
ncbi:MAG: SAM-dependent DNA methyltransferase [Verrucomicrobiaceae bacterium]|nr:SAM-dependent DNA methyltransferase [Verrucomicrobiaceae bacterium]